jgi:type I restriction enzyme R subunit
MPITPEDRARQNIDQLLAAAGWIIQNHDAANIRAERGVAIRESPMK